MNSGSNENRTINGKELPNNGEHLGVGLPHSQLMGGPVGNRKSAGNHTDPFGQFGIRSGTSNPPGIAFREKRTMKTHRSLSVAGLIILFSAFIVAPDFTVRAQPEPDYVRPTPVSRAFANIPGAYEAISNILATPAPPFPQFLNHIVCALRI
jgi:hypothetical protein